MYSEVLSLYNTEVIIMFDSCFACLVLDEAYFPDENFLLKTKKKSMEWDKITLKFGDFVIKQFYENEAKYDNYSRYFSFGLEQSLKAKLCNKDINLVKKQLVKLKLLKSDAKYEMFQITDLGIDFFENYGSLEKYLECRENEKLKNEKRDRWKRRKESWELSGKVIKQWIFVIGFVISAGFNIYLITNKSIKKDTTSIIQKDSILGLQKFGISKFKVK